MDAFMGMVMPVAFNFAPRGWLMCNGQTMSIAQNSALFSLLGTVYGGDGMSTFGIPDLRGRVVVGAQNGAAGPGLPAVALGEKAGMTNVTVLGTGAVNFTLGVANLPSHSHTANLDTSTVTVAPVLQAGTGTSGGATAPAAGSYLMGTPGSGPTSAAIYSTSAPAATVNLGGVTAAVSGVGTVNVGNTGTGVPVSAPVNTTATISNMQPYLGLNYVICAQGIYPSRN